MNFIYVAFYSNIKHQGTKVLYMKRRINRKELSCAEKSTFYIKIRL